MIIQVGNLYSEENSKKFNFIGYLYYKDFDKEKLLLTDNSLQKKFLGKDKELLKSYSKQAKKTNLILDNKNKRFGLSIGSKLGEGLSLSMLIDSNKELFKLAVKNPKKKYALPLPNVMVSQKDIILVYSIISSLPSNVYFWIKK